LAGQDQKFDDCAEGKAKIIGRPPNKAKLIEVENAVAALLGGGRLYALARAALKDPTGNRPFAHFTKLREGTVSANTGAPGDDAVKNARISPLVISASWRPSHASANCFKRR
jgi:hypothetical protein